MKTQAQQADVFPGIELPRQSPLYVIREQNGQVIRQRRSDGYFDVTAMCRAYGKQFHDYRRLDSTEAFLAFATLTKGIPLVKLIETIEGRYGGSWAYPHVALHCAMWVSPECAYYIIDCWLDWVRNGKADLAAAPLVARQIAAQLPPENENTTRPEANGGLVAAISVAVQNVIVGLGIVSRNDLYRLEDNIRLAIEQEISPVKHACGQIRDMAVGFENDFWRYFKFDPSTIQKHSTASGLPQLARPRQPRGENDDGR